MVQGFTGLSHEDRCTVAFMYWSRPDNVIQWYEIGERDELMVYFKPWSVEECLMHKTHLFASRIHHVALIDCMMNASTKTSN